MSQYAVLEEGHCSGMICAAGSYLINLGSPDEGQMTKSYDAFLDELRRCEALGIEMYNVHPGHTNRSAYALHSIEPLIVVS